VSPDAYRAMVAEIAAHPVDLGVYRLLHVKVSDIYHEGQITMEDASRLRSIINRAFADRRSQALTAPDEPKPPGRR
jgi:hypothetical protein